MFFGFKCLFKFQRGLGNSRSYYEAFHKGTCKKRKGKVVRLQRSSSSDLSSPSGLKIKQLGWAWTHHSKRHCEEPQTSCASLQIAEGGTVSMKSEPKSTEWAGPELEEARPPPHTDTSVRRRKAEPSQCMAARDPVPSPGSEHWYRGYSPNAHRRRSMRVSLHFRLRLQREIVNMTRCDKC